VAESRIEELESGQAAPTDSITRTRRQHYQDPPATQEVGYLFESLFGEGVEGLDAGQLEVLGVAGDHGQAVYPRRGRNERVDPRAAGPGKKEVQGLHEDEPESRPPSAQAAAPAPAGITADASGYQ
jgi:hypothetical protein